MRAGFYSDTPNQPHPLPPLASDCIGLYRLDEAAAGSNFDDISANNRDLTQAGNPGVVRPVFTVPYATVGSRSFDGAAQWGYRAHDANDELNFQDEWTIEAFIRPDVVTSRRTIFSMSEYQAVATSTGNEQCWFGIDAGRLATRWENGSGANVDANTAGAVFGVNANYRYHVAARKMRSLRYPGRYRVDFFIDGAVTMSVDNLQNSTGGSIARRSIGGCFRDGASAATPGSRFDGLIDDVIIVPHAKPTYSIREDCMRAFRSFSFQSPDLNVWGSVPQSRPVSNCLVRVMVQTELDTNDEWEPLYTVFGHGIVDSGLTTADDGGSWSFVNGFQYLKSVSIDDEIESQGSTATIVFNQNVHHNNLSPFVFNSSNAWNPINVTNTALALPDSGIRALRKVIVEVAPLPFNVNDNTVSWFEQDPAVSPATSRRTWVPIFDGFVSSVVVSGAEVTLACVDKILPLQIAQIEADPQSPASSGMPAGGYEPTYGTAGGSPVETEMTAIIDDADPARYVLNGTYGGGNAFSTNGSNQVVVRTAATAAIGGEGRPHAFKAGDRFEIRGTTNYNGVYTVTSTTTGTFTSVETPGPLAAENSGTVYSVKGYRDVTPRAPVLWVPTSPAWNVYEWNAMLSKSVAQELEDVAGRIGWLCRYRWDDDLGMFRLKFYNPSTSPGSITIIPSNILDVERQSIKSDDVRNIGYVEYGGTADNVGQKQRYIVLAVRQSSTDKYMRRVFRISAGSDDLITTSSEATTLVTQVSDDLDEPQAELEIVVPLRLDIEAGDTIVIPSEDVSLIYNAEPRFFSLSAYSLTFGCVAVSHDISDDKARTKLRLRGNAIQPSRVKKHFDVIDQAGVVSRRGSKPPATPAAPTVTTFKHTAGTALYGLRVTWAHPVNNMNRAWDEMEVHVSTVSGFTPSAASLRAVVRGTDCMVGNLAGGTNYYTKIIARDRMKNFSAASNQTLATTPV